MANIAVIIPTWNNNEYLVSCLNSLLAPVTTEDLLNIYVVNNGDPQNMEMIDHPRVKILQQKENLGWEGGLKAGIAASTEEFIVFLNDDTYIPPVSIRWANVLINDFANPAVGAVGPTSNVVMGVQNIFTGIQYSFDILDVNFLIGFCMMVRRSALEKAGGIDDTLPGGDDLDLSIRLRKAGYKLLVDRNAFVYHHGFKTGERINGGANVKGGWNSVEMTERTNWALIKKHGLREFLSCLNQVPGELAEQPHLGWNNDSEGEVCKQFVVGDDVLELACGAKKTVPHAVGVDRVAKGQQVPGTIQDFISKADICADIQGPLPIEDGKFDTVIVRHGLEHIIYDVDAVREWGRVLRKDGRLIIAVPNHEIRNTIPLNIEHVRAWTPRSLKSFMESQGWKTIDLLDPQNNISFVGVFSKNGVH